MIGWARTSADGWRRVFDLVEEGDERHLHTVLARLDEADRQEVGTRLPGHLAACPGNALQERAAGYRLAGAACLESPAEVAGWLARPELRRFYLSAKADASRLAALLRTRSDHWRAELATRLADGVDASWDDPWNACPNWELTAALVLETGVEPAGEGFAAGWALWRARRARLYPGSPLLAPDGLTHYALLPADPLLRHVVPYLFRGLAEGGRMASVWRSIWRSETIVTELAELAEAGLAPRRTLIDGCARRFLAGGGDAAEVPPFVALWRLLGPGLDDVPVRDFVRLLPSAPSPVVQVAVEELRRADDAGLLSAELFAEAVRALVFRPERKHVAHAVRWLAAGPPARSGAVVDALAVAFDVETPAVRERAARLAVRLAPYADDEGREAVREAAARLSAELREQMSAAYGLATAVPDEQPPPPRTGTTTAAPDEQLPLPRTGATAAVPGEQPPLPELSAMTVVPDGRPPLSRPDAATAAPDERPAVPELWVAEPIALAPPIGSVAELVVEWELRRWPDEPLQFEWLLAALVELAGRDRDAVAAGLRSWRRRRWPKQPFDPAQLALCVSGYDEDGRLLLDRCGLAIVSPADSLALTAALAGANTSPYVGSRLDRFVAQRFREVVAMFERRADAVPVLLATPTSPTGHVDPEALLERLARLGEREPLAADLQQALLRLPRRVNPEVAARAERLPVQAGRALAAWVRGGGLPDPEVAWSVETVEHNAGPGWATWQRVEVHARIEPDPELPEPLRGLCRIDPLRDHAPEEVWLPYVLPSHRELVAAHLLLRLPVRLDSRDGLVEHVAVMVHGDGPVGRAVVSTIALGLGHKHPGQRASAIDALVTLAVRGQLPAAELGHVLARLIGAGMVRLQRVTGALAELTVMGAYAEVWAALAAALPPLLPARGERSRPGLGDLLKVAADAAELAGRCGDVPGLAEVAARKGSSLLVYEARRLHRQVTAG
ncbi:hypothetical protein ACFYUK_05165 [Nonomuraea wenchangensis]